MQELSVKQILYIGIKMREYKMVVNTTPIQQF